MTESSDVSYRWRAPSVVADTVDGITVAIDLDKGEYYQFSADASALLEMLPDVDLGGAAEAARPFLNELVTRGVLEPAALTGTANPAPAINPDSLTYEHFSDLAHILMLDPIHDVDPPMGWPHADGAAT